MSIGEKQYEVPLQNLLNKTFIHMKCRLVKNNMKFLYRTYLTKPVGVFGSVLMVSDSSGFINGDLFAEWIDHFQKYEKANIDDPLIHIRQPFELYYLDQRLDRGFFGPLKTSYVQ
ncbi:hypothetical protein QE152_g23185 [Popillia japonica]|uniref:Uncharacterized protein n=1 Tax=Popillia japonica TaxID=7064 RepID=A0AAW1KJN3_POPJA